jgi:hypothetical protein
VPRGEVLAQIFVAVCNALQEIVKGVAFHIGISRSEVDRIDFLDDLEQGGSVLNCGWRAEDIPVLALHLLPNRITYKIRQVLSLFRLSIFLGKAAPTKQRVDLPTKSAMLAQSLGLVYKLQEEYLGER